MPVVASNNAFLMGIAKQTNEATTASVAGYSVPVFAGAITPVYDTRRVEVTDASSIQGDSFKGLSWWTADTEFPAYSRSLGRFVQTLWPTDGVTGAGPYTHPFTGMGAQQPWVAMYSEWSTAGAHEQTFGKGQATGIGFSVDQEGGPLHVRYTAIGSTPSRTAYTVTTADDETQGHFTMQSATASIKLDIDTPDVVPTVSALNVQSVVINMDRAATPVPTADGITVVNLGVGKATPGGTMTLIWNDWDMYNATFYGAVAGTAVSSATVTGALKLNFSHTLTADTFSLYMPKVAFRATSPVPSPTGDPITFDVALDIQKPASGDHIQPVLVNSVATAYSA